MELIRQVAERLVRFRVAAGLDLGGAAAEAGIEPDRLAEAEAGAAVLSEEEMTRLATAYGLTDATEIFGARITPLRDYA